MYPQSQNMSVAVCDHSGSRQREITQRPWNS